MNDDADENFQWSVWTAERRRSGAKRDIRHWVPSSAHIGELSYTAAPKRRTDGLVSYRPPMFDWGDRG